MTWQVADGPGQKEVRCRGVEWDGYKSKGQMKGPGSPASTWSGRFIFVPLKGAGSTIKYAVVYHCALLLKRWLFERQVFWDVLLSKYVRQHDLYFFKVICPPAR